MVWFSFHGGHTGQFCRHAKDDLASVVERAVAEGFTHYGVSEHAPRYRAEDLLDDERDLTSADLAMAFEGYTREAVRLRDQVGDRLELLVGFETERLPPDGWAERMRALRAGGPFDYIVGSVHDVEGQPIDATPERTAAVAAQLGGTEALQLRYFAALAELIEALRPEIVGHFDVIRKFAPAGSAFAPRVLRAIDHALEAARTHGCVLDVNCGAWRRGLGPVYPLPVILEKARALGLRVTLGDDSHGVASVGVGLTACLEAIRAAGFERVSYLTRREGTVRWLDAPLDDVRPRTARR